MKNIDFQIQFNYNVLLILFIMKQQSYAKENFLVAKVKLVTFLKNVWQTIVLLFIGAFSIFSTWAAFNLDYFCNENATPHTCIVLFVMFALFMHVMVTTIWEYVISWVKCNYPFLIFAGFVYFSFVALGLLVFVLFMWQTLGFWWGDLISLRFLAPLCGAAFFLCFLYKALID